MPFAHPWSLFQVAKSHFLVFLALARKRARLMFFSSETASVGRTRAEPAPRRIEPPAALRPAGPRRADTRRTTRTPPPCRRVSPLRQERRRGATRRRDAA